MAEVATAFGRREIVEDLADPGPELCYRAFFGLPEPCLVANACSIGLKSGLYGWR
jgi:hypothetical protein